MYERSINLSNQCLDSSLKFRTTLNDGSEFTDYCSWVRDGNETSTKCSYPGVSSHCPATCGACGCYDSTVEFKIEWKGLLLWKDCDWAANPIISDRCAAPGITDTCKETCGFCSEVPSINPSLSTLPTGNN